MKKKLKQTDEFSENDSIPIPYEEVLPIASQDSDDNFQNHDDIPINLSGSNIIESKGRTPMSREDKMKEEARFAALKAIEKKYGRGSVMDMGQDQPSVLIESFPSGSFGLDLALGIGGYPRGRIIEMFGPEMCLDGDTMVDFQIHYSDKNIVVYLGTTIRELWEKFNTNSVHMTTLSLDEKLCGLENCFYRNSILNVVKVGRKECLKLETVNGCSIVATKEHKFFTGNWVELGNLTSGDIIYIQDTTSSIKKDRVLSVVPVGERDTFDITMESPFNNFIANNFVVHNSGKSTLALYAIASAQKRGGQGIFIDAEHALDISYAEKLGVDRNRLFLSQPDYGEQGLDILETMIQSGGFDIAVVDSVAALVPKAELDGEIGDAHMALQARMMSQTMRKITGLAATTKTTVIFINQLRQKIGVFFGNNETTPGGNALKFFASIRLDIRKTSQIKDGENIIGGSTRVTVAKNKMAPPFNKTEFDLIYGKGICREGEIVTFAVKYKIISIRGSWYYHGDKPLGQGRAGVIVILENDKELCSQIEKEVLAAMGK